MPLRWIVLFADRIWCKARRIAITTSVFPPDNLHSNGRGLTQVNRSFRQVLLAASCRSKGVIGPDMQGMGGVNGCEYRVCAVLDGLRRFRIRDRAPRKLASAWVSSVTS